MEVFLARQPIFDAKKKVYAYEILYRSGYANAFNNIDGDTASASVIMNAFQTFGINNLTNNRPAFINFTENLLTQEVATIIPKESLVVEVLENVEANEHTIAMCKRLKSMGYTLALDDFIYRPEYEPLIALADIIKVDFTISTKKEIEQLIHKARSLPIRFLAEKVETTEEFEYAKQAGFSLFQGYFFCKPEILASKSIPALHTNFLQILNIVNQPKVNFDELAKRITQDLAIVYSLLKLTNSAAFGFKQKIHSVKHALVLLGEKEIRKWLSLLALQNLGKDKPNELMRLSMIRARFAELTAQQTKFKNVADLLFLAGLFSLLDVILDKPLAAVLSDVHAPDEVKECLLNDNQPMCVISKVIKAYERGQWDEAAAHADTLNLDHKEVCAAYINALLWYNEVAAGL